MHINNEYVKDGEVEPKELFVQTDITEKVEEFSEGIEERINNMLEIINSKKEPECSIGVYCDDPYECGLKDECWEDVPEESVFEFYRMLKKKCFELYDKGITQIKDVPESTKLNNKQAIQKRLACDRGKHIDKKEIKNFLKNLEYPIYYLDFETINPAIPRFDGMKPYQRIPFQYSLHIQEKPNSKPKHISFLADGTDDPRLKLLQSLKDNLGNKGSILVWHQSFEKGVLRECCEAFPEYKEWGNDILNRIKDLMDVFKDFDYYNPQQKGSASIKAVLPVMSKLKYDGLDISKGDIAGLRWEGVIFGDADKKEKNRVMKALEKYCELDTLAEVEILRELGKVVN